VQAARPTLASYGSCSSARTCLCSTFLSDGSSRQPRPCAFAGPSGSISLEPGLSPPWLSDVLGTSAGAGVSPKVLLLIVATAENQYMNGMASIQIPCNEVGDAMFHVPALGRSALACELRRLRGSATASLFLSIQVRRLAARDACGRYSSVCVRLYLAKEKKPSGWDWRDADGRDPRRPHSFGSSQDHLSYVIPPAPAKTPLWISGGAGA